MQFVTSEYLLKFLHCFDTTKLFAKPLAATVLFANGCNVPEVKD